MANRLLIYNNYSYNPYENLAIEHKLLQSVDDETIILYLWQNHNTVVIGKNQNPLSECDIEKIRRDNIFIARRLSGGGAVFHDKGNLNFTFLACKKNYDIQTHIQVIKRACEYAKIKTEVSGRNDILANGKKFSGNAFYYSKNRAYHHGTILINAKLNNINNYLTPDISKLQSKGIKSVKSRVINLNEINKNLTCDDMRGFLIKAAEEIYNLKAQNFPEIDMLDVQETVKLYSTDEYIYGTPIPYTRILKGTLRLGNFEIRLLIDKGVIKEIQVFTDSLDVELAQKIEVALKGVRYDCNEIEEHLKKIFNDKISYQII